MKAHPLRVLYEAGVPITLSTDDPGLFRCTLESEFHVADQLGLGANAAREMRRNAARFRFSPE